MSLVNRQSTKKAMQRQTAKKFKIMIVDDEEDIAQILSQSLQQYGFEATYFTDPQKALSEFKPSYDLLLLDIRMPGLSGFELCHEIKKKDADVKVCFLTAFEEYRDKFKEQFPELDEIKCYIKKPVAIGELVKRIEAILS
jgi:DNA-binding response OmpR family regulator